MNALQVLKNRARAHVATDKFKAFVKSTVDYVRENKEEALLLIITLALIDLELDIDDLEMATGETL